MPFNTLVMFFPPVFSDYETLIRTVLLATKFFSFGELWGGVKIMVVMIFSIILTFTSKLVSTFRSISSLSLDHKRH